MNTAHDKIIIVLSSKIKKIDIYLNSGPQIAYLSTLLALICPALICSALGDQIDFENLALRTGQKKAGQTETGQIKGRAKLGQLKFFAQNNWTCSIVCIQLK